ncbi:unnamed protein product [Prorocentrum cordatum]|uniref:Uncharacterized protein n=1 Tax=Prorocentrum cordatum TaxID=2364126 RepID=A0ABN9UPG3_9DINO|nr:unnamed protein product [Polarella glacialis]
MSKTHPETTPTGGEQRRRDLSVALFVCATPGSYNVTVSVDGVVMPMCPLQIDVGPGPASAHKSEVQGKDNQVVDLGGMGKFTVVAHDEFGNLCHEGGSRLGVRALGHVKLLEVTDNEDGTYQVVYSVPEWAQGPVKIEVLLDGVRLRDSPVVPQAGLPLCGAAGASARVPAHLLVLLLVAPRSATRLEMAGVGKEGGGGARL